MLIDSHCHLSHFDNLDIILQDAYRNGVKKIVTNALNEKELIECDNSYGIEIVQYAGVHPYSRDMYKSLFDKLPELIELKKIRGIGEVGLDSRDNNPAFQKELLCNQLDIAVQYDIPVSFHCVRKYYELAGIIKKSFPNVRGTLHGFIGSKEITDLFFPYNIRFGIHPGVLSSRKTLRQLLSLSIAKKLSLETDAPYSHHKNYQMDIIPYTTLKRFCSHLSSEYGINI